MRMFGFFFSSTWFTPDAYPEHCPTHLKTQNNNNNNNNKNDKQTERKRKKSLVPQSSSFVLWAFEATQSIEVLKYSSNNNVR